jgi:hypothetical protein
MLFLFSGAACGFASMNVDPLCDACNLDAKHIKIGGSPGSYSDLTPAGQEIMKRCIFTVFEECLADGLGENSFCSTVVSESARLGWTDADDLEHDKVVECALTSTVARYIVASLLSPPPSYKPHNSLTTVDSTVSSDSREIR